MRTERRDDAKRYAGEEDESLDLVVAFASHGYFPCLGRRRSQMNKSATTTAIARAAPNNTTSVGNLYTMIRV
jgi:hypothetical protein